MVTWHFITIRFAVIVLVPNALMNLLCLVKTILCSLLSTMDLLSWFYSVPFSYFLIWNYKVVCKWEHEIFWTFESRCHTVGQISKKCKETSNLMCLSLIYRGSPDSTVFAPPGNRTIAKTVLIGDWFSTKIMIYDFWIFKVPFFPWFIYWT